MLWFYLISNLHVQVLFLGCGDPTNPLTTAAASSPDVKLNIHINDISMPTIARNILIFKIVFGENFDANNPVDLNYLWDVWYNATWPESTIFRFVDDVKSLMDDPLPANIFIPEIGQTDALKKIFSMWFTCLIEKTSVEDVLASR